MNHFEWKDFAMKQLGTFFYFERPKFGNFLHCAQPYTNAMMVNAVLHEHRPVPLQLWWTWIFPRVNDPLIDLNKQVLLRPIISSSHNSYCNLSKSIFTSNKWNLLMKASIMLTAGELCFDFLAINQPCCNCYFIVIESDSFSYQRLHHDQY